MESFKCHWRASESKGAHRMRPLSPTELRAVAGGHGDVIPTIERPQFPAPEGWREPGLPSDKIWVRQLR